ncbi:hypothetical protein SAMN05446934_9401 [Paraburkholderia hospita]|nr:hypothetical protein PMI06_008891 [Burkholderia sp. BT03]SKC53979.1 hypothetical protein SAMN06266956_0639 [Paraburkholderia hospita]SKD04689.1 hypothetical protein SAMN05446934_9401 [Paraburkholderia hospita]
MQFDHKEFHIDASPFDEAGRYCARQKISSARLDGRRCRRSEVFG